ncbi:hypothetical protein E4U26_004738 [Claviceps purpurea]|nr:hypothetical protein E4U26_004738 [Claviceps purpurea]
MGPGLLTHSKDPNVTYEAFCRYVADAAYTQERVHREGQARNDHEVADSSSDSSFDSVSDSGKE